LPSHFYSHGKDRIAAAPIRKFCCKRHISTSFAIDRLLQERPDMPDMPDTSQKKNSELFTAFQELARSLGLAVRIDRTRHAYDSLALGNRSLKNALCIKEKSTSFFTADSRLREKLSDPLTGFAVEPAPISKSSSHNAYRFRVSKITPKSIREFPKLFEQLVRDSVNYVADPIAGRSKSTH